MLKVTIGVLATLTAAAAFAQPVGDPFAEKITKGDLRVELVQVADRLTTPVWGTHAGDGSGRLFIVDQTGVAKIVKEGKALGEPFIDVKPWMHKLMQGFDESGFLGLAFHPDFAKKDAPGSGKVYTYTIEPPGESDYPLAAGVKAYSTSVVAEWKVSAANPDVVDISTRRVVLTFAQPQFNHNGGAIAFGPDKLLYIGTGDGGQGNDLGPGHAPQGNGQSLETPLGKILRIDPLGEKGGKSKNGQYSIPADNPFVGKEGLDEVFAYGLRNPYRVSFDRETGDLIAADVGQAKVEEIDIITLGGNYGWPIKEGPFYFHRSGDLLGNITQDAPTGDLPKMIDPVAKYDHDDGISITGGFVYRGKAIPALQGKYVFGDWSLPDPKADSGRLFYADLETGEIKEFIIGQEDRALGGFVTGFAEDEAGELYVLTNKSKGPNTNSGVAWKIVK